MTMAETLIAPVPHLLPTRLFPLPKPQTTLAVFHLRNEDIPHDLASFCCGLFNSIVEEGKTYPQVCLLFQFYKIALNC